MRLNDPKGLVKAITGGGQDAPRGPSAEEMQKRETEAARTAAQRQRSLLAGAQGVEGSGGRPTGVGQGASRTLLGLGG